MTDEFITETTDLPIDAGLCLECGSHSWNPVKIDGCIDDAREKDPTYFFLVYLECRNCKKSRVVNFVGARPNILVCSSKKIVRPGIESEAAIRSRREFAMAAMSMF
jgi:hypothetical protein